MSEPIDNRSDSVYPWYKQFWPWLLIGLPATAVVAGITTLFIAIDNADSLVVDDYYKEGLAINRVLEEDDVARALHLKAELSIDSTGSEVEVSLDGMIATAPDNLELLWIHPTSKDQDFKVTVSRVSALHYRGHLPHAVSGHWYLQLRGEEPKPWLLRSEISPDERTSVRF